MYEDAIEQLQRDLDQLEAENAKLGKGDRQASTTGQDVPVPSTFVDHGMVGEQVENLKLAIRFLRKENALLKSKELYKELNLLPKLPSVRPSGMEIEDLPELDHSFDSSSSSEDGDVLITPSKHTIEMESKLLWKELGQWTSVPKIVDLSKTGHNGWNRRKGGPDDQVWTWKEQEKELGRKVERLKERSRLLRR